MLVPGTSIITIVGMNMPWLMLLGWTVFRYFRYPPSKYPRPDFCDPRYYNSWRSLESAAVKVALAGTVLSIFFTLYLRQMAPEATAFLGEVRTAFFLTGLTAILTIQFVSAKRGRTLGVLSGRGLRRRT